MRAYLTAQAGAEEAALVCVVGWGRCLIRNAGSARGAWRSSSARASASRRPAMAASGRLRQAAASAAGSRVGARSTCNRPAELRRGRSHRLCPTGRGLTFAGGYAMERARAVSMP